MSLFNLSQVNYNYILSDHVIVVNYDSEKGSFTFFDGFINQSQTASKEAQSFFNELRHASNQQEFINNTKISDQTLKQFINTVDSSQLSLDNYNKYINSSAKQTSKLGSVLKNIGGGLLSGLANAAAGFGIGLLITGVSSLVDYLVVTDEEIKEAADTAKSNISTARSEFEQFESSINSVRDRYIELSEGVERTRTAINNVDLSTSEYEEFLDLSNQLASLSPELVTSYDAQGNAILSIGDNAEVTNQKLDELIEKQRLAANQEIAGNLPDVFEGIRLEVDDIYDNVAAKKLYTESFESLEDLLHTGYVKIQASSETDAQALISSLQDQWESIGLTWDSSAITPVDNANGIPTYEIKVDVPQNYDSTTLQNLTKTYQEYSVAVRQAQTDTSAIWASLTNDALAWIEVQESYRMLDDNMQSLIKTMVSGIDWAQQDFQSFDQVESFLTNNILGIFDDADREEISNKFTDLFDFQDSFQSGEKSIKEYQNYINDFYDDLQDLTGLSDEGIEAVKVSLEFTGDDGSDLDTMINNVQGKLSDEFDDRVFDMSYEDLQFAYEIENVGDMTWDELMSKIEQARKIAENAIDIKSRANLEAFEQASEQDSYRADYDSYTAMMKQAQELFEAGEIGDERFKAAAEAFSKNGMDDAVNWQENYAALNKYFTEGSTGLETFVQDMSQLKDSSDEYFATWDEGANAWRLNLADITSLAEQMNMPLEMVSVLLQGLQQYGFTNDYFGTMEDGVSHLNDLYTELADKEAKLADLKLNHPEDTTAISELANDIDGLNESIETTIAGMQQLETMSIQDLETQYEQGRAAAESLIEQYKQLEDLEGSKTYDYVKAGLDAQLEALASEYGIEIVFNSEGLPEIGRSMDEIEDDISQAQSALDSLRNSDGTLNMDSTEVKQAQLDLQTALQDKQKLTQPAIMSIDASQIDGDMGVAIAKLQEIQTLADQIEVDTAIGVNTDDAEQKLANLVSEFNQLDGAKALNIKLDAKADIEAVQQTISEIQVDDLTQVINGDNSAALESIDQVTSYAKRSTAIINVTANTVDALNAINSLTKPRTATVTVVTQNVVSTIAGAVSRGAGGVNGTAHADGTVGHLMRSNFVRQQHPIVHQAYYGGDWGIPYDQTALVGEIGPELLVRDGKWQLIGQRGPGFQGLKRGDIIFNSAQTEQIFKNGWVTGRGKTIGFNSHAMGTINPRSSNNAFYGGSTGSFGGAPTMSQNNWGASNNTSSAASTTSKSSSKSSGAQKEADEFLETIDEIVIKIDRLERAISQLDLKASSTFRAWDVRTEALSQQIGKVTEEIDVQQQGYERYLAQANSLGLSADWIDKIQSGKIDIETITDEDLYDKIQEYQQWYEKALDCRDAVEELRETESELYQTSFENVLAQYDDILAGFDHQKSMLDEYINQAEEQGFIVSIKYYQAQIDAEQKNLTELEEKRASALSALQNAMASGTIAKGSEAWYDMCQEIDDVTLAIEEANTALLEYNNSIRDVNWEVFDLLQDRISNITKESDFLIDLFDHDQLYDDRGQLTNEGMSTMGLHGVNYNVYMAQADKYAQEIQKLNQEIANDPYDQELIDRRQELLELQQDMITAAEDEKEAIRDMVEEGINLELDALQELIDKYTEALDSQKDLYDYQKQISEQTSNLSALQKQMSAYENDDSEEARAKRQQLSTQIEDAQQDLDETEYEQSIADQKKLLDELYTQYEEILNLRLDDLDALIMDMIGEINNNADTINTTINDKVDSLGFTLSDAMSTIWDTSTTKLSTVLTTYGENLKTGISSAATTVNNALNTINVNIQNMINQLNNMASTKVESANTTPTTSSPAANPAPAPAPSTPPSNNSSQNNKGDGVPSIGDAVKYESGNYYYSSDGMTPTGNQMLGQTVYIGHINNASWATKPYALYRDPQFTQGLGWVSLDQISGYKRGGKNLPGGLAWTQEGGQNEYILRKSDNAQLTVVGQGDAVLNHQASNVLYDIANSPKEFLQKHLPEINRSGANSFTQNLDKVIFNMPNVKNYEETIRAMQSDKNFEKLILAMTINQVAGQSSLSKYKAF